MAHVKKLTRDQRLLLRKQGIVDCTGWVYTGLTVSAVDGKSLNKQTAGIKIMNFHNRDTGKDLAIPVGKEG